MSSIVKKGNVNLEYLRTYKISVDPLTKPFLGYKIAYTMRDMWLVLVSRDDW